MAEIVDTQSTRLYRNNVLIPQVFEVGPVGFSTAIRQVTSLSDTDCHKHKIGLPDMTEIAVKVWYDPQDATHQSIWTDSLTRGTISFTLGVEEGDSPAEMLTMQCFVMNPQIESMAVDADVVLSFTLKPNNIIPELGTIG